MKIKKRHIKEEIERLERMADEYYALMDKENPYTYEIGHIAGEVKALEWVLGFSDD